MMLKKVAKISWDFIRRHATYFIIGMIALFGVLYILPEIIDTSTKISQSNTEILAADRNGDTDQVIELKGEQGDLYKTQFRLSIYGIVLLLAFLWAVFILLASLTLYVYTNIKFWKAFAAGDDGKFSLQERTSFMNVMAATLIAIAILMVGVLQGMFAYFFGYK